MRAAVIGLVALSLFPALGKGGEKETYLQEKMIPLAQKFIKQVGLPYDSQFGTNEVIKSKVDFFNDRPGCLAEMRLTNGYFFSFHTEKDQTELWSFQQISVKTYYELDDAPKEKVEAVKALNFKNKLNDKTALELARKFFALLGHKDEDFLTPECRQSYWVGKNDVWGNLPYYEVVWYRKDVKMADVHAGIATLPVVRINVSGIDSTLLYYLKSFMPIGSDF